MYLLDCNFPIVQVAPTLGANTLTVSVTLKDAAQSTWSSDGLVDEGV